MIDIIVNTTGDIAALDTQTLRAKNILSTQLGDLVYATTLGIDLKYFLSDEFKFQNSSFKSYLIQVLASYSINVASLEDQVENLFSKYVFNLTPPESDKSLVAR